MRLFFIRITCWACFDFFVLLWRNWGRKGFFLWDGIFLIGLTFFGMTMGSGNCANAQRSSEFSQGLIPRTKSKEAVGAKRSLEVQNQLSIPLIVSFLVGRQRFSRRCTKSVNMLQDARKNRGTRNFLTIPQGSRTKGVGYILQQHPSRAEQQLKNERGLIDYEWRASYNIQREKKTGHNVEPLAVLCFS